MQSFLSAWKRSMTSIIFVASSTTFRFESVTEDRGAEEQLPNPMIPVVQIHPITGQKSYS